MINIKLEGSWYLRATAKTGKFASIFDQNVLFPVKIERLTQNTSTLQTPLDRTEQNDCKYERFPRMPSI